MTVATIRHRKKRAFLAAYGRLGTVLAAAEASNVHRQSHRNWMANDPRYAAAFEAAKDESIERMEHEARRRAVAGWEEPVYHQGQVVGTVRKFSDLLLIFMLKAARPEVYRERFEHVGPGGGPIQIDQRQALAILAAPEIASQLAGLADTICRRQILAGRVGDLGNEATGETLEIIPARRSSELGITEDEPGRIDKVNGGLPAAARKK